MIISFLSYLHGLFSSENTLNSSDIDSSHNGSWELATPVKPCVWVVLWVLWRTVWLISLRQGSDAKNRLNFKCSPSHNDWLFYNNFLSSCWCFLIQFTRCVRFQKAALPSVNSQTWSLTDGQQSLEEPATFNSSLGVWEGTNDQESWCSLAVLTLLLGTFHLWTPFSSQKTIFLCTTGLWNSPHPIIWEINVFNIWG